jgi:hypothetical protein
MVELASVIYMGSIEALLYWIKLRADNDNKENGSSYSSCLK